MTEDVRVAAFVHAKPGLEGAVQAAALACIGPTRAEAGNNAYFLHRDAQDRSLFVFIEHWKSQQALNQHMRTPHFKNFTQSLEGRLAQPMIVHVLHPV